MPRFIDTLLKDYRAEIERRRNRPFLDAVMAACALAACAKGEVSFSQRICVDQVLETLEQLRVFDPREGAERFNHYAQGILYKPKEGREAALKAVAEVTDDLQTAGLLVRICLAVAESDGGKSLSQQIEIVMLCSLLRVDPGSVGLYTDSPSIGLTPSR